MKDVINKVCGQLITNPHIIGIIRNCESTEQFANIDENTQRIDLCIVSKEAGNQKLLYMEDEFVVCLRWRTTEEFLQVAKRESSNLLSKEILYDRTGFIKEQFQNILISKQ